MAGDEYKLSDWLYRSCCRPARQGNEPQANDGLERIGCAICLSHKHHPNYNIDEEMSKFTGDYFSFFVLPCSYSITIVKRKEAILSFTLSVFTQLLQEQQRPSIKLNICFLPLLVIPPTAWDGLLPQATD